MSPETRDTLIILWILVMGIFLLMILIGLFSVIITALLRSKYPDDPGRIIRGTKPLLIGFVGFLIGLGICYNMIDSL